MEGRTPCCLLLCAAAVGKQWRAATTAAWRAANNAATETEVELEGEMSAGKTGNDDAAVLLYSATRSIVLTDRRPQALEQIENGNKVQEGVSPDASPSAPAELELLNFRVFPDSTLVEAVKNQSQPARLRFLVWNAETVTFQEYFEYGGSRFVPSRIDDSLLRAIRLPTGIAPVGNAAELIEEITLCIAEHIVLAPEYLTVVSHFVLYTWFQDRLGIAPYLWVIGPYSAGKTRLLRLLHALCRRPVMASDISPAALYSVPSAIMPTLLIDEFETSGRAGDRDRLRLLRSGSTRDGHVIRGSKVYDTFCAKVVASRQEPSDAALASRAIFIPMRPTSRDLPCLDTAALQQIADRFQPRLLNYRLNHFSQVAMENRPKFTGFMPRVRDLALALAAPVLGNSQLEAQLFRDLVAHDKEAKLARYGEPEWAVTTALFLECHSALGTLTIGGLSCTVRDVLTGNGETYELSPRKVGAVLRSLGFISEKLGNQGRGFRLTRQFVRRVHELALDLGIKRADILPYATVDAGYAGRQCFRCNKLGLLTRNDGKKLRTVRPRDKRRPYRGLYD